MHILTIGHVVIDDNSSENVSHRAAGGVPIFMSKIFSKLSDVDYTIVSQYGKDFEQYRNGLKLYPSHATLDQTPRYANITSHGTRTQKAFYREGAEPVAIDGSLKNLLLKSEIIIISPLFPTFSVDYLRQVFSHAQKEALKVLLPQGYYRDFDKNDHVIKRDFSEAENIFRLFDLVILSEQDGDTIESDVQTWIKEIDCTFVVTKGENGCEIISGLESIQVHVDPVAESDIVDSVGSGDIFAACFSYKYKLANDLSESGKFANAVARECLFYTPEELQHRVLTIF